MKYIKPKIRYSTRKSEKFLAKFFEYSIDTYSQDWPYEVAEPKKIGEYINAYNNKPFDENTKITLMQMIIQANNDQPTKEKMEKWWLTVSQLLKNDFRIHECTIYYWCVFDTKNLDDCFAISSAMRQLWYEVKE